MTEPVAVVKRVLPAPCSVVYEQWLSVESLAEWMCPRPARLRDVQVEPVVGGRLRFDIVDDGTEMVVVGRFLTLEPPHRIRFTWSCSTWPDQTRESVVTVDLRAVDADETHMTIRHELLPPGTSRSHRDGWQMIGEQLESALSRRTS